MMGKNEIERYSDETFESIKHINEYGQEFWYARELQGALEYGKWDNFKNVIDKAMEACQHAGNDVQDHFADVGKMVQLGSGSFRKIYDYALSRYACYLIVMNGDPRKQVIAIGQSYFAVKTRQQELIENYGELSEDEKCIAIRSEMRRHNKQLADAAHDAGVVTPLEYAAFQNYGYRGLYGGLNAGDIKRRKGLKKNEDILDHMGSTELAANLFRATQTEEKLKRDHVDNKQDADNTHYEVGKKVRKTIQELGGTMPEDLPTPEKSIKQIEHEQKKMLKQK